MIKGNTRREIRFKDGYRIFKGETVLIRWPDPRTDPTRVEVLHKDRGIKANAVSALGWIGLTCSDDDLDEAILDGACETPNGIAVEPDGVDSEGVPSWLLIHGLI